MGLVLGLVVTGLLAVPAVGWGQVAPDGEHIEWTSGSGDFRWEQVDPNSFSGALDIFGVVHDGSWDGASSTEGGPYTTDADYAYFLGQGSTSVTGNPVRVWGPGSTFVAPAGTVVNSDSGFHYTFTDQSIEGTGSFEKGGASTVTLENEQNLYSGGTTIYGGRIVLNGADPQTLLDTGAVTVTGGSTASVFPAPLIDYGATLSGTLNINGRDEVVGLVTLDNNGTILDVTVPGGSVNTGSLTGSSFDVRDGLISAILAGPGSLTKNTGTNLGNATGILAPDNTVILSALNTYTGTTTIADGTLEVGVDDSGAAGALGNGGTVTFTGGELQYDTGITQDYSSRIQSSSSAITVDTNGNNVTYASELVVSNNGGLTKLGVGTLSLTDDDNNYSGTTTVAAGTLALNNGTTNNNIDSTALIEVQSGAVLDVIGLNSSTFILTGSQTLRGDGSVTGSVTAVSGSSVTVGDGASAIGDLDISSAFSLNAGANLNLQISDAFTGANPVAGTDHDQLSVTGAVTLGGALNVTEFDANPAGSFNPDFAEVFTIVDNLGGTSLTGEFSNFAAGDSVTIDSHVLKLYYNADGDSGQANDVVLVNASGPVDPTVGLYVDDQFTTNAQVDGNQERGGSQTAFVGINAFATTDTAFASLNPADYPPSGDYSGIVTLNGNSAAYAVNLDHTNAGDITLNLVADLNEGGGVDDVTISNLNGSTGDSVVLRSEAGSSRGNLIVQSGNFGGAITQNNAGGTLTKTTAGNLTLTGNNTYTGATTISDGILQLGDGNTTGSLTGTTGITNNGNLTVNRSNAFSQATDLNGQAINGSGSFTQAGSGTTALTIANGYTGTTQINAGTLQADVAGAMGSGSIDFEGGTLRHGAGNTQDYSSRIQNSTTGAVSIDTNGQSVTYASDIDSSNTGGLTKLGTGTLNLTTANTYTGATTVSAGTLNLTGTIASNTTVQNTATLSGTGTVNGSLVVHNGGSLSVAELSTVGTFTVAGEVDLQSGSTAFFDISSLAPNDVDTLNLSGFGLTANGTIDVDLLGVFNPALGDSFKLASFNGTATGSPSFNFTDASLTAGLQWNTDNFLNDGTIFVDLAKNYWDVNGIGGGATDDVGGDASGNWSNSNWSLDSTGGSATGNWDNAGIGGSAARFSAGVNGIGNITVIADDDAAVLTAVFVEEGAVLIADGTATNLNLNGAAVEVNTAAGTSLTVGEILADDGTPGDGINKTGDGELILTGDNTYTGATAITDGTLTVGNNTSAGSLDTSAISVSSGATFEINRGNAAAITQSGDLSGAVISGAGDVSHTGDGTTTFDAANTYTGTTIIANGTLEADEADVLGVSGALGNGGDIEFEGGTLQYTANSAGTDYSSRIVDSGGAISVNTNGQSVTYATALANTNTGGLTKEGAGTLTLSAAGNAYTGDTTVNGGTLNVTAAATVTGTSSTAVNSGGTLNLDGSLSNNATINSGGTLTGTGTINGNLTVGSGGTFSAAGSATTGNFTVAGTVDLQTGSNSIFEISNLVNFDTLDLSGFNLTANGTIDVDLLGVFNPALGNSFKLANFNGTATGTPSFDFSGAVLGTSLAWNTDRFLTDGIIDVVEANFNYFDSNGPAAGTNASGTFSWNTTNWTENPDGIEPGGTVVWENFAGNGAEARFSAGVNGIGNITVNADETGIVLTGIDVEEGDVTIAAGSGDLALNGASAEVNVVGGSTLTIAEPLTNDGAGDPDGINKTNAGTLILTGENTFTGGTTVSAGSLVLGHATNTLADAGDVTVNGGTAILAIGANDDTVGDVTLLNGTIQGTTGVLTGSSYTVHQGSVDAILAGTGTLTKESTGTVTVTKSLTYSGDTIINDGELSIGDGTTSGALRGTSEITGTGGALVINQGAGEFVEQTDELNNGLITGGVSVIQRGDGTTELCLDNTYTGNTTVEEGTLVVCGTHSSDGSTYTVEDGGTLTLQADGLIHSKFVNVDGGGTLSGSGTIGEVGGISLVTIADGGYLSPGDGLGDIGTLTINGDLDLVTAYNQDMDNLQFDWGPGGIDQVIVTGEMNLGDTPELRLNDFNFNVLGPIAPGLYTVFSFNSLVNGGGVVDTSPYRQIQGDLGNVGGLFTLLFNDEQGVYLFSTNNIFDLIPEPSRAMLLAFGGVAMLLRRQRPGRRRSS